MAYMICFFWDNINNHGITSHGMMTYRSRVGHLDMLTIC